MPLPNSAQRLLAFLALHGTPQRRLFVAGMLWMDFPEERASANLRSALWRLQQPGHRVVEATSQQLRLDPTVAVDTREIEGLAHRLRNGAAERGDLDVRPDALSGELLRDWYDDWVLVERERFRQVSLHALEALSERLATHGRYDEAVEAGIAAVASEPLRESAHRVVIKAHIAEGNACEAIRQYRFCRELLADELGIAPSSQLAELLRGLTV